MVFSAPLFLFFFLPIFFILYYLSPQKLRNYFLLFASIVFYTWGAPKFILIVLVSIVLDYAIVLKMSHSIGKLRKNYLILSLLLNIGLLAYFKYANFFVENVQYILELFSCKEFTWTKVLLPIGISFLTFQKISYSIDVYRKTVEPLQKLSTYALYILMFPQLVAGPIIRFKDIHLQLEDRTANSGFDCRVVGFIRFIVGLSKKVLIANVLSEQVDAIFALSPDSFSTATAWIGVLAYTFQIYFDFSGYSDMALGLGKMMGFDFPENFNFPYISQSISEFWKRWHITLGSWIKDYLYIPLGGNRVSVSRMYINLWIAFLISGLWHGAAWTFVAWGAYHGFFIVADKLFLLKLLRKAGKIPSRIITFFIAMFGWLLFRAESIGYAWDYFKKMFAFDVRIDEFYFDSRFICILVLAAVGSFIGGFSRIENLTSNMYNPSMKMKPLIILFSLSIILYFLCGGALLAGSFNPFIYFRF